MLQPIEKEIECHDGTKKAFVLSKFPALAGREIVSQYPLSALPKIGDYAVNESMLLKLMAHVAVPTAAGEPLRLTTRQLIDNHVPDFECLMRIEAAMMEYNVSFFANGKGSAFFEGIAAKAQALIIKTLTDFVAQSSQTGKQPSTNSEPSTP